GGGKGPRAGGRRGSTVKSVVILLLLAGGAYFGYVKFDEYHRDQARVAAVNRAVAERDRREKEEQERLAKTAEREREKDAARRKKQEEEKRQAEASLAGFGNVEKKAARKMAAEEEETVAEAEDEVEASPEFLEAMGAATAFLKRGEWEQAKERFAAAATLTAPEELQDKARALSAAAGLFQTVSKETPLAVETTADELYWVTLKNGNKFRGHLDKDRSGVDDLAFVKNGGGVQRVTPGEIAKKELLTQDQRDKEMREELRERQADAKNDGVAWYLCGVRSLEYNQKPISIECFFTATEKDPHIAVNAVEFLASRLFALAMLDRQLGRTKACDAKIEELKRKYPKSRAALTIDGTLAEVDAMAEAMRQEKEERKRLAKMKREEAAAARLARKKERQKANKSLLEIDDEIDRVVTELAESKVDVRQADSLKSRAADLMETAKRCDSRAVANRSYKEALENLTKAAGMYQKAMDSDPGNREVERKLDDVRRCMFMCRKMQTL
ncbi:MAG: hypothetical protein J6333_05520, partial [Planctomycetes bacterium]|nr:hypothetical protein [Planctomycetota bacterium]